MFADILCRKRKRDRWRRENRDAGGNEERPNIIIYTNIFIEALSLPAIWIYNIDMMEIFYEKDQEVEKARKNKSLKMRRNGNCIL